MSIKNSVSGMCGFLASIAGGAIVSMVQNNGNMVFGVQIYAQQILSAISFVLIVAAVLYIHFVIAKQKVKIQ